jgi:hypothetical protein
MILVFINCSILWHNMTIAGQQPGSSYMPIITNNSVNNGCGQVMAILFNRNRVVTGVVCEVQVIDRWCNSKLVDRGWRMASSGMLHHVALVRTYTSDELSASFIRVTRIGELGRMLAVTSNRCMLRRNTWFLFREAVVQQYHGRPNIQL